MQFSRIPRPLLLQLSNARLQQQHPPLCELSDLPLSEVYERASHYHAQGENNLLYPYKVEQCTEIFIAADLMVVIKPEA